MILRQKKVKNEKIGKEIWESNAGSKPLMIPFLLFDSGKRLESAAGRFHTLRDKLSYFYHWINIRKD
jgi:hypothetical protein